jgi:AraC-like DNA-binding protein
MEIERRQPSADLRPFLVGAIEGWRDRSSESTSLREPPSPVVPLLFNFDGAWEVEDPGCRPERREAFLAGMHDAPTIVRSAAAWECIEVRVTPLTARRILRVPMRDLANRSVALDELLPGSDELMTRLRATPAWPTRFGLVEDFLRRRLADSSPESPGVEWSWNRLRATGGRAAVGELATQLGWSHRRLIHRFREHVGLPPKTVARVFRLQRAMAALSVSPAPALAEIALECGYFDQAHLNRDFRELAGTTPTALVRARLESGGIAA